MLYQIKDGTVSAGGKVILSHIDFEIHGTEKIAVVGKNGAGKTTLLNVIAGAIPLDRDDKRMGPGILCSRKVMTGMLSQQAVYQPWICKRGQEKAPIPVFRRGTDQDCLNPPPA